MTLEECKRLLKHFNELADGTINQPVGHKDWADVVYNAKLRAVEMEKAIEHRLLNPKYHGDPESPHYVNPKPKTKEVKKRGSSSNRS